MALLCQQLSSQSIMLSSLRQRPRFIHSVAAMAATGTILGIHCSSVALAQPKAQILSNLERNFVAPPAVARPWVYWFVMDGNFTREGITADLEGMKRAGIGGLIYMEVNVGIPRGPVKFMSPEWQQLWKHVVRESERLGIEVTLNGGPGWTGSGGPWVKPEASMQNVTSASLDVTGPRSLSVALPQPPNRTKNTGYYRDIRVLAFPKPTGSARIANFNDKSFYDRNHSKSFYPSYPDYPALAVGEAVASNRVLDLTAKMSASGQLNWDVPEGEWTIVRFGATNNGATTLPAPAPGLGLESDKFSKTAFDAHFKDFIGPLLKTVGPRKISADSGWNMLHIDSWEVGTQNWTPNFLNEFKTRRGYDATPYLPTLSGVVVDSQEKSERFLWDWRQTCQDLVVQNHVAHFADVAHKNGFGLSIEAYDKIMASDISLGSKADVPMAEFWLYEGPDWANSTLSEAASTAHTNGRKIVGAEAFTSGASEAWRAYPGNAKALGDWAFTEGINRFVIHRYQHQPTLTQRPGMTMGPYGVHWERTQTWWDLSPAYHRYLARSQYMLRQGLPVADICYLLGEGAPLEFRAPGNATKGSPPERLGYSFDACAPETLMKGMTVKNGRLTLPDGTNYRVLVLPERATMTPALLEKVAQLVAAGATVIGPRPVKSPSLSGYEQSDARVQQLGAALWGDCDGVKVTEHAYGQGKVIWRRGVEDLAMERPNPLRPGQLIWYPEGRPASAAPVAKRYFRRTFDVGDAAQVASAQLFMTADNRFDFAINGQGVGEGNDYHRVWSFDLRSRLKSGSNTITVTADNGKTDDGKTTPNPAGLVGTLRLKYRDGRVVEIPTDNQWQSATTANSSAWSAALSLGETSAGPWNLSATAPPEQYGDFGIVSGVLRDMKVPVDFESDGPIRYIHRREGDAELYFVANREDKLVNANCLFRVTGKIPELWNPLTGERRVLSQYQARGGQIRVPLRFEAHQSWFVIFRSGKTAPRSASNFPAMKKLSEVSGAWNVSFDPKWGGPGKVAFPKLMDWSQSADKGIRYYSGQAVYRKSLTFPRVAAGQPVYLDLGVVDNLAKVKLNGRELGVVWCAPWRVELKGLRPGANDLEITVANLWPNRLIGDQSLPAGMRTTSTTWNFYKAGDPLLPSGLLGPVTVWQGAK
jgi:hypothetical protein